MQCYAECRYPECHYAESCIFMQCYAECRYPECRYAECHGARIWPWQHRILRFRIRARTNILKTYYDILTSITVQGHLMP
jgi:hypothetical protein